MHALLIIDLQNDFCPGGSLAVPGAQEIIPLVNRLQTHFELVLATQDWHPPHHCSFATSHSGRQVGEEIELDGLVQRLWPVHCLADTWGAQLHPELDCSRIIARFRKGTDPELDSYSGLFDNGRRQSTGLEAYLRQHAVTDVWICGLAIEYCVKFTALDAVACGFCTRVVRAATRGVGAQPDDIAQAWAEMARRGVQIVDDLPG